MTMFEPQQGSVKIKNNKLIFSLRLGSGREELSYLFYLCL